MEESEFKKQLADGLALAESMDYEAMTQDELEAELDRRTAQMMGEQAPASPNQPSLSLPTPLAVNESL